MSHNCKIDCGIEAIVDYVDLSADKIVCVGTDRFRETSQALGMYPLAGDFSAFGFDLVVDQDLQINQTVTVPTGKTWKCFRDLEINAGGDLRIDGTLILG